MAKDTIERAQLAKLTEKNSRNQDRIRNLRKSREAESERNSGLYSENQALRNDNDELVHRNDVLREELRIARHHSQGAIDDSNRYMAWSNEALSDLKLEKSKTSRSRRNHALGKMMLADERARVRTLLDEIDRLSKLLPPPVMGTL